MIYFDNAATSFPKPAGVKRAVDEAITRYGANPGRSGHDLSVETAKCVFEVREKAAALFGASDPEQVVFTQNCTQALNTVIKGLLRPGDHVVISDLEHNAVYRPVYALAHRGELFFSIAATYPDPEQTAASFCAAMRPNTRAVIFTAASNVFGIRLPVELICQRAHERGIYTVVDAAQAAGAEPIDMAAMGIDFLCTAGHKSLYGPTGTGLLVTRYGERLRPLCEGGTGSDSKNPAQPDFMPDRLEAGTINTVGILGLGAGLDFLKENGLGRIMQSEQQVLCSIYDGLARLPGVRLYTPRPVFANQLPVLSFNLHGLTSEETTARLNERGFALRGGLHCAPLAHQKFGTLQSGGTARLSVGAFNTPEQGWAFVRAVEGILAEEIPNSEKKIDLKRGCVKI